MIGFSPAELRTGESTRSARLKWVVVVEAGLPPGRAVNAAVCVAAATSAAVHGLLGPAATDRSGVAHPGLPWAGCSVLAADAERLALIRAGAIESADMFVSDMPVAAQTTRVYDAYLAAIGDSAAEDVACLAVSVVGPRQQVDKLVGGLRLLP